MEVFVLKQITYLYMLMSLHLNSKHTHGFTSNMFSLFQGNPGDRGFPGMDGPPGPKVCV